jgi:hypothetical protein
MTREEFKKVLKEKDYPYKEEGGKIVIIHGDLISESLIFSALPSGIVFKNKGDVHLRQLDVLPSGIIFMNRGSVYLHSLTDLSPDVEFKNGKNIYFGSLKSIPPGVKFENKKDVDFRSITTIPPGVIFDNGDSVYLECLIGWPFFGNWPGNIEGIDSKKLFNKMISDGLFDRN